MFGAFAVVADDDGNSLHHAKEIRGCPQKCSSITVRVPGVQGAAFGHVSL